MSRTLDVAGSTALLLLASPVLGVAAIAIRIEDGGPVLYRQRRVGLEGREFELLKLRTMVVGAESMGAGFAVNDGDARITRTGRVLRRLSVDELPQLWNVMRGEMALVGPRPTLAYQVARYTPRQRRRLEVRPGITGWAQVNGRAALAWADRIELDVWYVEHRSLWLDLKILARTPFALFGGTYKGQTGGWKAERLMAASQAVLLTCAGQRVDIVCAFREAGAIVVAADLNPLAPALYHADRRVLPPRVDDPDYVPLPRRLSQEHGVSLVVPLTDLDQRLLAERRADARRARSPARSRGGRAARTTSTGRTSSSRSTGSTRRRPGCPDELPDDLRFPVLVKPRRGFGSRNIFRAADRRELDFLLGYTPADSMVQAVCDGEEFSIDVFCDVEGRCLAAIPRTMIESKGGESIKGMSIRDPDLIEVGCRVAETLGIVGPANVQCFRTESGRHEITDVNVRFGGGFPVPHASGGGYPELSLALARGERPEPRLGDFREGVVMTRYFWQVCLQADDAGSLEPLAVELPVPSPE